MAPSDSILYSVLFSAIIQEASSCSRWECIQRTTALQHAESKRSWNSQYKMGSLHPIPTLRAQKLWRCGSSMSVRAWGAVRHYRNNAPHIKQHSHMNSHDSMHKGLPRSKPYGVSALRGESFLNMELSLTVVFKGKSSSLQQSLPKYTNHI